MIATCRNEKCDCVKPEKIAETFVDGVTLQQCDIAFIFPRLDKNKHKRALIEELCLQSDIELSRCCILYEYPCVNQKDKKKIAECIKQNFAVVLSSLNLTKVVCFGRDALKYFTGKEQGYESIGQVIYSNKLQVPIFTIFDPDESIGRQYIDFLPDYRLRLTAALRSCVYFLKFGVCVDTQVYIDKIDTISSLKQFKSVSLEYYNRSRLTFDFETNGLGFDALALGIGIANDNSHAMYIPIKITPFENGTEEYTDFWKAEELEQITGLLWEILQSAKELNAHESQFDLPHLYRLLGRLPDSPKYADSLISKHLWHPHAKGASLDDNIVFYPDLVGYPYYRNKEVYGDGVVYCADKVTVETTGRYCCGDVLLSNRLETFFTSNLSRSQQFLYDKVFKPAIEAYGYARIKGVKFDSQYAENSIKILQEQMQETQELFASKFGFNYSQKTKLAAMLQDMGAVGGLLTDGGKLSISTESVDELYVTNQDNPRIIEVLDLMTKLATPSSLITYSLKPLLKAVANDGRIHTTAKLEGTVTLRRAYSNPNLQNIPKRKEESWMVRGAFVPEQDNWILWERDLSAIEMYLQGFFAKDEPLMYALEHGISPHSMSASKAFNLPLDDIKKKYPFQYSVSKTVNFAKIYGAGIDKIRSQINKALPEDQKKSKSEVQEYVSNWDKTHFACVVFKERMVTDIKRKGYVETPFGHKRYLTVFDNANTLYNTIMQNSSGLLILLAIALTYVELKKKSRIQNFPFYFDIHDAALYGMKKDDEEEFDVIFLQCLNRAAEFIGLPKIPSEKAIYNERFGI